MTYMDDCRALEKELPSQDGSFTEYDGMTISRFHFQSDRAGVLPDFESPLSGDLRDRDIEENRSFPYYTFRPGKSGAPKGTIILIHGLNEKSWVKYLPWAAELCRNTEKTILLFPIAFHMDRAPADWSSPRKMQILARERQLCFKTESSSFVNAALSARLHAAPERFFFSGLEAYFDVLELLRMIRRGSIPGAAGRVDFFGYSIGAFLTQMLMLANSEDLLSDSRAVLFCGGTTLDLMNPVSRYIMDSAAADALKRYVTRTFTSPGNFTPAITETFHFYPAESRIFMSMALDAHPREERERLFQKITGRLSTILLKQDRVMPAEAVRRTLTGRGGVMGKLLQVLDFPFPHDHVTPFPQLTGVTKKVDSAFRQVFALASEGLA